MSANILLVDDHDVLRIGVRSLFAGGEMRVVGEASTGSEALHKVMALHPDLALVDVRLPDMSGIQLCEQIRRHDHEVKLVILTSVLDNNVFRICLQVGIQGYLLKDLPGDALIQAVRLVLSGKSVLDPTVTTQAIRWMEHADVSGLQRDVLQLRDVEILRLISQGRTNQEIGRHLHLSEHTIKSNVNEIYRILGVSSRIEAAMEARYRGII